MCLRNSDTEMAITEKMFDMWENTLKINFNQCRKAVIPCTIGAEFECDLESSMNRDFFGFSEQDIIFSLFRIFSIMAVYRVHAEII